ncbi:MAG: hypothetical protein GY737_05670 [Desulfobacteraceae bacterium]|nr:hypothetical protein [Desulfobacteraceae bacterium]
MLFFDRLRAGESGSLLAPSALALHKKGEIEWNWEKWVCRLDPLGFEIAPFY